MSAPATVSDRHARLRAAVAIALLAALVVFAALADELAEWQPFVSLDRHVDELLNERATPALTTAMEAGHLARQHQRPRAPDVGRVRCPASASPRARRAAGRARPRRCRGARRAPQGRVRTAAALAGASPRRPGRRILVPERPRHGGDGRLRRSRVPKSHDRALAPCTSGDHGWGDACRGPHRLQSRLPGRALSVRRDRRLVCGRRMGRDTRTAALGSTPRLRDAPRY